MDIVFSGPDLLPGKTGATSDDSEAISQLERRSLDSSILEGKIVSPGDVITNDEAYMRGFGTYKDGDLIRSSCAGTVGVLNKLITASSFRGRYTGEIGDVVIARISELSSKKWKVDLNSRQDGILLLASVILPGGVQRRKSESDELKMRHYLAEGDLLVAEVQAFYSDNSISLHTRSTKYGKLRNGCLVIVPPLLVQRSRSHFILLSCGVSVILGLNGYIWVSKHVSEETDDITEDMIYSSVNEDITDTERETIARVVNCIKALSNCSVPIFESNLSFAYEASLSYDIKDLLTTQVAQTVSQEALNRSSMV